MGRCGFVALIGRPNAGKSTLLNALVGQKIAVVSRKPQTTRNRILGITQSNDAQILFVDTPGMHENQATLLNQVMNRVAINAAAEADLLVFLIDSTFGSHDDDWKYLSQALSATQAPWMLLLTKSDAIKYHDAKLVENEIHQNLDEWLANQSEQKFAQRRVHYESPLFSAKRPKEVGQLRDFLGAYMPEGPKLYPEDDLTDRSQKFLCGELIREQLFRQLGQELPYGCGVRVERIEFKENTNSKHKKGLNDKTAVNNGKLVAINAEIVVSRTNYRSMLIGEGGQRIKAIGIGAREALERHFECKIYLDLVVKVLKDWHQDQNLIQDIASMTEIEFTESRPN